MRLLIGMALGAALSALAPAAMAQSMQGDIASPPIYGMSGTGADWAPRSTCCDSPPTNTYVGNLVQLKAQIERQTRRDGGHLTLAHEASLQKELDQINRRFHKGRFADAY
jgi:hypothetical protein